MGVGNKKRVEDDEVQEHQEGQGKNYGKARPHDPTFNGPIEDRSCTDIICCLIFLAFLGGQGYIAYLAFTTGDPSTIIHPTDSQGEICGVAPGKTNLTSLFFFDWLACFSYSTLITLQCATPQVCVDSCPTETYSIPSKYPVQWASGTHDNVNWNDFICQYGVDPENEVVSGGLTIADLLNQDLCATYYVQSKPLFGRCMPDFLVANVTDMPSETPNGRNITQENVDVFTKFINYVQQSEQIQSVVDDFKSTWPYIVAALGIVVLVSFFILILMRWLMDIVVFGSIVCLFGLLAWGMYYCYDTWLCYRDGETACYSMPINDPFNLFSYLQSENTWLTFAIILTVIAAILLLLCLVLFSRFRLAAKMLGEASEAVGMMMSTLAWPLLPFVFQFGYVAFWAFVAVYLASAGVAVFEVSNAPSGSSLSNGTTCDQMTFNSTLYAPATCQFVSYGLPSYTIYLQIYGVVGLWWMLNFFIALGEVTLAGAFASYYWAFTKPQDIPSIPLVYSFWRAIRYHLGSMALGALIITIVQLIRALLELIEDKTKDASNVVTKFIFCCCKCGFWCLEKFLRFINKNAYIEIAVYGRNFCSSAASAFNLLMRNIVRVSVLNGVTGFMLFLLKSSIVVGISVGAFYFFQLQVTSGGNTFYVVPEINNIWVPITAIAIVSFFITTAFFGVYDMAVDTLFLSFLEDLERNDGSPEKPYYMSKGLMDLVGKHNKKQKKHKDE
ncbi:choline transporter-like protein 4 [Lytechinus pictus]|uniref:choline transporter-like protein 4 n=1 Tax=Lytechinus pictus TaxID=7653 RepID=UPI0030B9ECB2